MCVYNQGFDGLQDAHALLSDVVRLAAVYQIPVTASALHVYHSAAVTMPACLLWETLDNFYIPVLVSERPYSWPGRFFNGHTNTVMSVSFSSDGKYIVSGAQDSTVRVWDTATRIQLCIMDSHEGCVNSVAFFGDDKKLRVVSGSEDCTVRVSDAMTGAELHTMHHEANVNCVAISRDGQLIASGSSDCTVWIWEVSTGTLQFVLVDHDYPVCSVAFSSDNNLVVSGFTDGTLRVWDAATGMQRLVISGHKNAVRYVAFSKDGRSIISGADDGTIRVWSTGTGTSVLTIDGPDNEDYSPPTSHSESLIASGSYGGTIQLWDATTGHLQALIVTGHENWITSIAISDGGTFVAAGYVNGPLWVSEIMTPTDVQQQRCYIGHTDSEKITPVVFSDDGMFIVSGSPTDEQQRNQTGHTEEITTVVYDSHDGKSIASWSPTDEQQCNQTGHTDSVTAVAFSGDGMFIASGSSDCTAKVWSARTGEEVSTLSGHMEAVISVALSGDGKHVVSGSDDHTVRLWDATAVYKAGTELHVLAGHENSVYSVAISGDGKLVASGSRDHTVRLWDGITGTYLFTISGHENMVTSIAFSDDSSLIISGSSDETIRIWDAATGTHQQTITDRQGGESVVFSNGGSSIVSRSRWGDGTMRVWEAGTVNTVDGASLPQYVEASESARYDQFKIDEDGWIYRLGARNNWQRVCWLPSERRGRRFAHFGQTVCIGTTKGIITILDFSQGRMP
jgi:WD40 repeat protein